MNQSALEILLLDDVLGEPEGGVLGYLAVRVHLAELHTLFTCAVIHIHIHEQDIE